MKLVVTIRTDNARPMTFNAIETREIDAIRRADHFTASLFLGRGQYRIETRPTVLAAMQAAREIEQDPAAHTRRALIYAIAPDGYATLLTAALIAKLLSIQPKEKLKYRA